MAKTFYSYLAFIEDSSNADIHALKNNLEDFYAKSENEKPTITFENNQIDILFNNDYSLYVFFSEEEHINDEAREFAAEYKLDWNENTTNKEKLKASKKRFEIWGDDDFDMDYFNDSLFVIEQIEKFNNVIIFHIE
ncbi:hypothetical protein IRZ71_17975 [Flavobacterium sp. ANB]|uniref:hypothetical protein n=1 Tax=unclassified Flavobacterium TaxID=196869 RepID=UPI0012B6BFDD|nr:MULTISPECIES: hypothetical protein [unclassified Flavobacterium]MBF4518249.1 hypothetical protein [Flavobacterium sp. ANB]MTD71053.1 hypothetical protein [Flavobacterium sp. LC2016-13]